MDLIEIIGPSVHPMPEPLSDNATTGDSDNSSKHADEQDHTNSTDEITAASAQTELAASQDSVDTTLVPSEQIANAIDSNETDNSDTTGPATT